MGATSEIKVSGPLTGGVKGWPFAGTTVDVAKAGYVEEEYIISGTATRYRLAPGAELGHDGRWDVESAGRLGTYVNAVQPVARVFDGFLLEVYFGLGTPLEVGDYVLNIMDPDAVAVSREQLRGSNRLRDDLDVPVMVVNSELEASACY